MTFSTPNEAISWAGTQPWAAAMRDCPQDANWHAEGDVWTHTEMVTRALSGLEEWSALAPESKNTLLWAAILHDVGKPKTTGLDEETGKLRAHKHALVGFHEARQILRQAGVAAEPREEIANLVRYHGRPPHILESKTPELDVIKHSWLVNNRLLYLLALADNRGRISIGGQPEDSIHLWKLVAQEQNCFNIQFKFANDTARIQFFRGELTDLYYTPHEAYRSTGTMMSGLPGAGKDTWLAKHSPALPVVALDAIRDQLDVDPTDNQGGVIQAAREACREHLRLGQDFAFNATNVTALTRQRWINLFLDYHAKIHIVYIEPPLETILQQNNRRPEPVPTQVILRLSTKLEPPTLAEAHQVTLVH